MSLYLKHKGKTLDAGIKEAPKDDKLYGRKDGDWIEIDVSDMKVDYPPIDDKLYGVKNKEWEEILIDDINGYEPDGINIILNIDDKLDLSDDIKSILEKVDTDTPIQELITNIQNNITNIQAEVDTGLWQQSSKFLGTATPSSSLGVNGDFYFMYI